MTSFVAATWSALRQLVDGYAVAIDTGDLDALAALFTEDGEYVGPPGPDGEPSFRLSGREQIRGATDLVSGFAATVHVVGALRVETRGRHAHGLSTCAAHHLLADGTTETHFVSYRDDFVFDVAGWLFVRRAITSLWREGAAPAPVSPQG